jgi:hypothetical protein
MELTSVMPGIDVRADIIAFTPMRIVLPASGRPQLIPRSIVTGQHFSLPVPHRAPVRVS